MDTAPGSLVVMIITGNPTMAECDGCGEREEAEEARNPRTGTLSWGFLPAGWKYDRVPDGEGGGEDVHRCATCAAGAVDPFGDRRAAFVARLDHLGAGLAADISVSLGVPIGIGRRWAAEWQAKQQERSAA
ncbi:hypothetical protein [Sphingomonas sp. YL-JM2C]